MDRLAFIKSIGYDDFEKSIVRFFDENMALYNLIGEYRNIDCITGNVDGQSITFDLKFKHQEDSEKMCLITCGEIICIYGHLYSIKSRVGVDCILNIELIDTSEECCDRCN